MITNWRLQEIGQRLQQLSIEFEMDEIVVQGILFYTTDTNNRRRLDNLKSFADVRQLLRDLNNSNLWFELSLFSTGAAAGIGAIVNSINQQDLNQLMLDEGVAEVETELAA